MAHRDRRVALEEEKRHGLPDQHAPSDDDRVPSGEREPGLVDQPDDPERRAWPETRLARQKPPLVHWVEAVHVLLRHEGFDHAARIERTRQWKLDEDAVDFPFPSEIADEGDE